MEAHPEYDASLPSLYLSSQPRGSNQTPRIQGKTRKKKLKAAENCNSRFHPCATESTHTHPPITSCPITLTSITHLRDPREKQSKASPLLLCLPLSTSKSQAFHVLKQAVILLPRSSTCPLHLPPHPPIFSLLSRGLRSYFPPYRFRSHKFHGKRD